MLNSVTKSVAPNGASCTTSQLNVSGARRPASGFTLLELLIAIAIISVLIALLLPGMQSAREAARRTACANNFEQAADAMHNYHQAKRTFPPGVMVWAPPMPGAPMACSLQPPPSSFTGFAWGAYLLPYVESGAIYQQIDFKKNFFDAANRSAIGRKVSTYLCASDSQGGELVVCCGGGWTNGFSQLEQVAYTNMAGVADTVDVTCDGALPKHLSVADGVMAAYVGTRASKITDGLSKTLMLGEVTGAGAGTYSGDFWASWDIKSTRDGINAPESVPGGGHWSTMLLSGFSSFHRGGCQFVLADGSVHFFSERIAPDVMAALTTRAGGEIVEVP
jgi:prepilin-type N-terminal cleavage/methylation domain-containing protein